LERRIPLIESKRSAILGNGWEDARRRELWHVPEKFDLVVIGCGPAGEKGGAQAAYFGKKVSVIERAAAVAGSRINTGTVPSKTLQESALYFCGLKQRGLYGIDYSLKENLTVHDFMHHERAVVEMERKRILKNLERHKIELVRGQAAFEDAHTLVVTGPQGARRLHIGMMVLDKALTID
jgi:NAD(P) transhydrogenase